MINTLLTKLASEESPEATGIAALGFDLKAFLIQLVTFLLVLYILKRFAFGKIVELLEKRRQTIEEGVGLTARMKEEKEKLDREVAKITAEARNEADRIIADSHSQAGDIIKSAEENAQEKVEHIMNEARKKIEDETARARRNLEKEMVDLVIEATEAVTKEKLDAKKDNKLIADALKGRG